MSDSLPASWAAAAIGDICEPVSKHGPDRAKRNFRYVDLSSIDRATKSIANVTTIDTATAPSRAKQVLASGDVLFSNVRVYLENIAQVPRDLDGEIGSTAFCVLRPAQKIEPRYLYHFVTSRKFVLAVDALQRGNSPPSVQDSDVRQQTLPVAPLSEQRRIVSKIDELFSRIDEGEAALARVAKLVERYRQSVLKAAVTGELTRDWRAARKRAGEPVESGEALLARILKARRAAWEAAELAKLKAKGKSPADDRWKQKYKEPAPPNTTDLPELPDGWVWATLPQLGEFGRGKSKHRPRNDPKLYGGSYPFLQTGTVRSSRGRITSFDTTYNEQGLAQSKLWPKGTVCITIAANIAESGILDFDACFPDSIVGFVPSGSVIGEYVEFFIRTARDDLERYAPATAQKNINLEILEQVAIPLPPYAEQQRVLASAQEAMSKIDAVEHTLGAESSRSTALRQSILKAAFSGQLVPQDPHDEPASKLLERIAAERAATATQRKHRGTPRAVWTTVDNIGGRT